MFWKREIHVPPGFVAVVNSQIVRSRPLYVGRYDQVYFISFAPVFFPIEFEARCREAIVFETKVSVRVAIQEQHLGELLHVAGDSTHREVLRVSAKQFADGLNLSQSIGAAVGTFVRGSNFFSLVDQASAQVTLNEKIQTECAKTRLEVALVSMELSPKLPSDDMLLQLRAQLGAQAQTDSLLGGMVTYLAETAKQHEQIKIETERARAELKIAALDADARVAARQAELQEQEADRQRAAQARNAEIMEANAHYEFAYKTKRLEEQKELSAREVEIAKVKEGTAAAAREQRRLDMELEIERERKLADIRATEREKSLSEIAGILEKVGSCPAPNYEGVRTLITNGGDWRDQMSGLLWNLVATYTDGLAVDENRGAAVGIRRRSLRSGAQIEQPPT